MENNKTQTYMKLQMEELKTAHGVEPEQKRKDDKSGRPEDKEIADLYSDCAEYEDELDRFERELEIIATHPIDTLAEALAQASDDDLQETMQKLHAVILHGYEHKCEQGEVSQEIVDLVAGTGYAALVSTLAKAHGLEREPVQTQLRAMLEQRWQLYIDIKKEHIKEEVSYIKALGLKPHYAQKVYRRYHGLA